MDGVTVVVGVAEQVAAAAAAEAAATTAAATAAALLTALAQSGIKIETGTVVEVRYGEGEVTMS